MRRDYIRLGDTILIVQNITHIRKHANGSIGIDFTSGVGIVLGYKDNQEAEATLQRIEDQLNYEE